MEVSRKQQLEFPVEKGRTTKEKIENTFTDELILAICSPIGSLREDVIESLIKNLEEVYKYEVTVIKLSDFIESYYEKPIEFLPQKTGEYSRLLHKISGGDYLRKQHSNNSILVELAIKKIREDRKKIKTSDIESRRMCYVIDSLKNLDELKLLRSVYRDIFYMFSIFSLEKTREDFLIKKGISANEAKQIIETDEFENISHGQDVRNTFVEGDFFVRVSEKEKSAIERKIIKYLHLIFNSAIITPNIDETAMYHAKSSAGNSACLSRQVGATITDNHGTVIARGWNDVPKFGGNLYDDSVVNSMRCKNLGYCSNVTHRNLIIDEIKTTLGKTLALSPVQIDGVIKVIETSQFKNVIEYSRSIHAEMHAIIIGSQLSGDRMVGGNLYCTTYPCHNCARHIVLAGIKKIYYIEPYKKSLCLTLHSDSITEDEDDTTKVRILLYDGVAPRRYLEFYSMGDGVRKDAQGNLTKVKLNEIKPKNRLSLQAIPDLENQAIHSLYECGLIDEPDDYEK